MNKSKKGITLIALIITIIVMLILSGIVINLVFGQDGVINQAQRAGKENEKAKVEEEIYLILSEWPIEKIKGTQTILEFLNSKVASGELDEIKEEGSSIEIYKDGYVVIIDFEGKVIEKIQESTARIKVSNIKVMLEDGVTEASNNSLDLGTKVKIVFDVSIKDGKIESVTNGVLENGKVEYTTDGNELQKEFTITGKVNGEVRTRTIIISVASKYKIQEPEIKLSTQEWTNDKITVDVDWKNAGESDKKEISVDGGVSYTEYSGKVDIYKNTIIKARVTTKEGVIVESELEVDKIDKLAPNTFTPTVSDLVSSTELTINANTTDQDATEEYGKSEIKEYVYYVYQGETLVDKSELISDTSWNASGLVVGESYNIYVEAYDNARNMNKSETLNYTKLEVYIWKQYSANKNVTYSYTEENTTYWGQPGQSVNYKSRGSASQMFDASTGKFNIGTSSNVFANMKNGYFFQGTYYQGSGGDLYKLTSDLEIITSYKYKANAIYYKSYPITTYTKGDSLIGTVKSNNPDAYPDKDGAGNYWYEKVN